MDDERCWSRRSDIAVAGARAFAAAKRTPSGIFARPESARADSGISLGEISLAETDEELWREDDGGDHSGWWCVRTDPFPCPAWGCTFVAQFMTAAHLVLVWQERDDPNLLWHAQRAKEVGRNPRVVAYEPSCGPSASYYAWEAAGRPVHGVKGKPTPADN